MPEIVQPEAVTVWYLKACCFCGWPEVVSDEYGRRYGNPAVALREGNRKSVSLAKGVFSFQACRNCARTGCIGT